MSLGQERGIDPASANRTVTCLEDRVNVLCGGSEIQHVRRHDRGKAEIDPDRVPQDGADAEGIRAECAAPLIVGLDNLAEVPQASGAKPPGRHFGCISPHRAEPRKGGRNSIGWPNTVVRAGEDMPGTVHLARFDQ